jgi:arsenite methyltransferase
VAKFEFDDEGSRLVEKFNASPGAMARRARILSALALKPGDCVLDVGSGPGNQALEIGSVVGSTGRVEGIDPADSAVAIARSRCSELPHVSFQVGEVSDLPFADSTFDVAMSSQVFEYIEDVPKGLAEILRVLKKRGRVLIHDTDWGAALWHSSDRKLMAEVMKAWDDHLADPHLPQTLKKSLAETGFEKVRAEAFVQLELDYDLGSVSGLLMRFIVDYVVSQGFSVEQANAWADDLRKMGSRGEYFFSSTEYIFTGVKP